MIFNLQHLQFMPAFAACITVLIVGRRGSCAFKCSILQLVSALIFLSQESGGNGFYFVGKKAVLNSEVIIYQMQFVGLLYVGLVLWPDYRDDCFLLLNCIDSDKTERNVSWTCVSLDKAIQSIEWMKTNLGLQHCQAYLQRFRNHWL